AALGIAAFGSFIAGTLSVVILTFLAPFLARVTLSFGPPENFALMVLGLTLLTYFARESMVKALMMAAVGLLCGTVGQDTISGRFRFAFGIRTLEDGLGLVPVIMGRFGISEVLLNLERREQQRDIFAPPTTRLLPRNPAWRGRDHRVVRLVRGGEASVSAPRAIRRRRDRGRGRPRGGQQR